jgi:hypothetical protein
MDRRSFLGTLSGSLLAMALGPEAQSVGTRVRVLSPTCSTTS